MAITVRFLLVFALWGFGMNVLAEEVGYPGDQRLVLSMEQKVRRSLSAAAFVAVGRFVKAEGDNELQPIGDGMAMQRLDFHVSRRIDRGDQKLMPVVNMKLAVYLPLKSAGQGPSAETQIALLSIPKKNEKLASGKLIVFGDYLKSMRIARDPVLKLDGYQREYVAVPLRVGSLDAPYRLTDEIIEFSKNYIIFIFQKFPPGQLATLFPSDIDIYMAEDPDVESAMRPTH